MTEKYVRAVEKYRELILKTERQIWENPETGFKEYKTANYMEEAFEALGYDLVRAGNIPGFYTILDTGRPGPEVLILGELDSLSVHQSSWTPPWAGKRSNDKQASPCPPCRPLRC